MSLKKQQYATLDDYIAEQKEPVPGVNFFKGVLTVTLAFAATSAVIGYVRMKNEN